MNLQECMEKISTMSSSELINWAEKFCLYVHKFTAKVQVLDDQELINKFGKEIIMLQKIQQQLEHALDSFNKTESLLRACGVKKLKERL